MITALCCERCGDPWDQLHDIGLCSWCLDTIDELIDAEGDDL